MGKRVKILSIDGGGIRGIIPATLLARIEQLTRKPIAKLFDLIAGTSTGGIIALGLTKPGPSGAPQYSAQALADLYEKEGSRIFSRPFWYRLLALDNLSRDKYPSDGIDGVLQDYFGEARLRDAATEVLIPSYEIERGFPFFFRSSMARIDPDYDFPMRDAARATSAAPTYFEPLKLAIENTNAYYALIDGGTYANNPAACALVEARATHPEADQFLVVSLGTGTATQSIPYNQAKDWGVAGWAKPILNVVFNGVSSTVDYQLRQLMPSSSTGEQKYFRFQPVLTKARASMDNTNPTNIAALKSVASFFLEDQAPQIEAVCESLEK